MNIEQIKERIKSNEYDFLREDKNLGSNIIILTLGGSHAYGMDKETSDLDVRGIALNPKEEILLGTDFEQVVNVETDTTVYSFNKMIQLLTSNNPNTIEILGCKPEHYLHLSAIGKELLDSRKMFLSKICIHTFGGYAGSQLRRMENKAARLVGQAQNEAYILKSINNAKYVFKNRYYPREQDYFEEYNRVKDAAINMIKESEAYQRFNNEDMNKFAIKNKGLPAKDIFHPDNDGKLFISIDMRKANFSSLLHYDRDIFSGANTWEEFINKFTSNKHIINSKYIRQAILGNCNPKRHITYEKYLMDQVLDFVTEFFLPTDKVVFFSNDEIVFDVTYNEFGAAIDKVYSLQKILEDKAVIPLKIEPFILYKIGGTDGYYKEIFKENGERDIEFKCLDNYMLPFVLRKFLGEEITDSDKVFYHEGLLAQFIKVPKIEVSRNII